MNQQLDMLMQQKSMKMGKSHQQSDEEEEDDYYNEEEEEEESSNDEEIQEEEENAEQIEAKLPEAKAETKSIMVTVKKVENGGSDDELSKKIGVNEEFKQLMVIYCMKFGNGVMNQFNIKFMFNGACVRETDTPLQLFMLDKDVIYVFSRAYTHGLPFCGANFYKTLCVRIHKRRDTFVRVTCTDPLVQQLKRHVSLDEPGKSVVTCFFYQGIQLNENHCVSVLRMDDGDVLDAFAAQKIGSTFSINAPSYRRLTPNVMHQDGGVYSFKTKKNTSFAKMNEEKEMWIARFLELLKSTPQVTISELRAANAKRKAYEVNKSLMTRFCRAYQIPDGLERQLYVNRMMNDYKAYAEEWSAENLGEELEPPPMSSSSRRGK